MSFCVLKKLALKGAQMCNTPLHHGAHSVASSHLSRTHPAVALSYMSRPATPRSSEGRRRWTEAEITEILTAISTLRTSDLARTIGVTPKALRSLLRRNGVSLRALRGSAREEEAADSGLVIRRSALAPSAVYGAAALEDLDDNACRWPIGDPSEPDFSFCGAPAANGRSYCCNHLVQAFTKDGAL
jgi:GcrA cell cycle regulator